MTNRVGLWIDHKHAVIVSLSEQGESVRKIESGAKRIEYRGGARGKTAYAARYTQGENQLDNQFMEHLNKYYDQVAGLLRDAGEILILGPGEAKGELAENLERAGLGGRIVATEAADKMTARQIAARVRERFSA